MVGRKDSTGSQRAKGIKVNTQGMGSVAAGRTLTGTITANESPILVRAIAALMVTGWEACRHLEILRASLRLCRPVRRA